jgi:5-methylthioadenosine/S-adenosylhomocysteine deaminase
MTVSRTTNEATQRVVGTGSAIGRFHGLGLLEANLCLAHLGWVEPPEIELLLAGDVKAVHSPSASMLGAFGVIAHGTFPEMIAAGLTVALGSDACAISRFVDLVRVAYIAACAHKDVRLDATAMGAHTAFEMAPRGGARALRGEDRNGSLEPGKAADLVVFDTDELEWHPNPLRNPVANLVYSASGRSARTVIIDGEVVMEDRVLAHVDLNELRAEAATAADRVLERIGVTLRPPWPVEAAV